MSSSLLQLIPPLAIYRRNPLDWRLNALGPWQYAVENLAAAEENGLWENLLDTQAMPAAQITPVQATSARAILRRNAACRDALERGLERGRLQFDEFQSLQQIPADTDFVTRLGDAARLLLIRFHLWSTEGDLVSAAESLFRLEKIGAMISSGEGQMLHYLVGLWLRTAAARGFARLAAHRETPRAVLQRILQTVDECLKKPDGLAVSFRVDLCTFILAQLDRNVEDAELEKVVDQLLEVYYAPPRALFTNAGNTERAAIADGWRDERRRQIVLLLGNHPKPYDKAATARLMGAIVTEAIRAVNQFHRPALLGVVGRWHRLRRKLLLTNLARKTQFWPAELAPGLPFGTGAHWAQEGEITTVRLPAENLTEARLTSLQAKLRRFDNPIGLMLAEHLTAYDYGSHLREHLAMIKTMRGLMRKRLAAM